MITGYSNTISVTTLLNPDAQAFITAAGITNPTEISAINTLVNDLQGYGLWTKMKAIYPFVGGTSTTHKYNLKDPRDLDAAFRLVFSGGWTHSSTGATPNGTNGYADTNFNPTTEIANDNTGSFGIYSRTDRADSFSRQHGAVDGLGYILFIVKASSKIQNYLNSDTGTNISNTNSQGFYQMSRDSSTNTFHSKDNTINTVSLTAKGRPNINLFLAARNNTSGTANAFDNLEIAFAYYSGQSLTTTNLSNFYTAVQAFQTTLSRQV